MAGKIDTRLTELGIELPEAAASAANYVPYVITGNLVFISGQITLWNGELMYKGRLGENLTLDDGLASARLCALNLIAQLKAACDGDLDRVSRCVRLGGFVNCTPDFTDHPKVINGASDLMAEIFGEAGKHARAAVGCSSLPLGIAVEIEGVFEIE
ncbi:MAG: RidA family protein [Rhodospirillaceae bacterium]|jgi:enamine deaminase RidA (YjgF/YER057c/UK114 family)|nr:RidA family protein [Rhodospirillaceae bacterium]MBT5375131.1 RidA family protein [Rhodospirillaceae bacterium]MBT5659715.1 RidA family protein [Rhodospirillaceae bacterium]MBT5752004.1 RidA family protein [Rhodospirillaceae bacterium]